MFRLTLAATALALLAPAARADAVLIPLNGPEAKAKPADVGYTLRTVTVARSLVHIYVELSPAAAKAFGVGELQLTHGGRLVAETTVTITKDATGKGTLKIALDPLAVDGGELTLWSGHYDGVPLVPNFGGYRISVTALLADAAKGR